MNQTVSIGDRIREERQRLDMTQPAIGEIAGVTKKTQGLYESGERLPDAAYLAAVTSVGVDVLYVLTGIRSKTQAALAALRQATELASKLSGSKEDQAQAMQSLFEQMQQERLTAEERELLSLYKAAPLAVRAAAVGALTAGSPAAPDAPAGGKRAINLANSGDGVVQVGRAGGKVKVRKG